MAASRRICVLSFCFVNVFISLVFGDSLDDFLKDRSKEIKIFTDTEISLYDGSNADRPIYMAVKGIVFDVSTGKDFYGKDAAYNALVGKDSTRAVAKMSLDPKDLNRDLTGLSEQELQSLEDVFKGTYEAKYPRVGYMDYLVEERIEKLKKHSEL